MGIIYIKLGGREHTYLYRYSDAKLPDSKEIFVCISV